MLRSDKASKLGICEQVKEGDDEGEDGDANDDDDDDDDDDDQAKRGKPSYSGLGRSLVAVLSVPFVGWKAGF